MHARKPVNAIAALLTRMQPRSPGRLAHGALLALLLSTAASPAWADAEPASNPSAEEPAEPAIVPPADAALPPLPGPHQIATLSHELVDTSRTDPFAPVPRARSVVAQLWYPAVPGTSHPPAPYMSPEAGAVHDRMFGLAAGSFASLRTHARANAPALRCAGGWPVLLFSPGGGVSRSLYTVLLEGIASEGFVVVALDHPYDAAVVQFPDGRVLMGLPPPAPEAVEDNVIQSLAVRVADTHFVLDQLPALDRLLGGVMDRSRIGMFGHSLGGATAGVTMLSDARIAAGVNVDGAFFGPPIARDLERPFMLVGAAGNTRQRVPGWAAFWSHLRGFRRELQVGGTVHMTFTDLAPLSVVFGVVGQVPNEVLAETIGTVDGLRAAELQQTYLRAFFDRTLRGRPSKLLDGPDARYPEVIVND